MKAYFIGSDGRLRLPWRLMILAIVFLAIAGPMTFGARSALGGLRRGSLEQMAVVAFAATVAVFVTRRVFDKRSIASLGTAFDGRAVLDLLAGMVLSVAIIGAFFAIALTYDLIRFDGYDWTQEGVLKAETYLPPLLAVMLLLFAKFVVVGWWEELMFRGYLLRNLLDSLGMVPAIAISSVIFGFAHIFNPNASLLGAAIIMLITLQLIGAYLLSGRLWLPVGMHIGWNFAQGPIFGFRVSGTETPSFIDQTPTAETYLSGGAFGPEASVVIIPLILVSLPVIYLYCRAGPRPSA